MTRCRYELTDREWSILSPLLPDKPRGVSRVDDRCVLDGHPLALSGRFVLGRNPRTLWAAAHLLQPFRPLAKSWGLGSAS